MEADATGSKVTALQLSGRQALRLCDLPLALSFVASIFEVAGLKGRGCSVKRAVAVLAVVASGCGGGGAGGDGHESIPTPVPAEAESNPVEVPGPDGREVLAQQHLGVSGTGFPTGQPQPDPVPDSGGATTKAASRTPRRGNSPP